MPRRWVGSMSREGQEWHRYDLAEDILDTRTAERCRPDSGEQRHATRHRDSETEMEQPQCGRAGRQEEYQVLTAAYQDKVQRIVIGYEPRQKDDEEKRYGCWDTLNRIRSRFDELKDLSWEQLFHVDEYIFRYPNGERAIQEQLTKAFKRLLKYIDAEGKEDGLLKDDFGNERTLYCLRHTYASRRRYEGMSYDDLSVQMGTSVKMLEYHYSHFTVSDNPNKFAGHEKREDQERKQEQDESAVLIKQMAKQGADHQKQIAELLEQNRLIWKNHQNEDISCGSLRACFDINWIFRFRKLCHSTI